MQEIGSSLPSGFRVGKAVAGGDCFFDSFRQGLKEISVADLTVKELRQACKNFASEALGNLSDESYNWLHAAVKGKLIENNNPAGGTFKDVNHYMEKICESAVWGDSDIEGRIFCGRYSVKLCVAEMQKDTGKYNYILADSEGVHDRGSDSRDYNASDTIRIVNRGLNHFEPVLRKQNDRGSNDPLNDLKKEIEDYPGESFHFANIFAGSGGIYSGYYNNQNSIEERSLKFAVLTNEKDSQNEEKQIVRCYTISRVENSPGSRFSERERALVGEELLSNNAGRVEQSFAFKEHKMFMRKDGGLVCKPFSEKRKFPENVKGQCDGFKALNGPFSPPHASTPITRRNIPRGHDKAYAYKFLKELLETDISPDVLVDIMVDSKDDTKITIVGRPKVLGSSTRQMRHVISYSSVKDAIKSAVKVKERGGYMSYVENMVEQVMIPLIMSKEGVCLTDKQYSDLKKSKVIPDEHDELKLTTETKKGQRNKYHLMCDKEIIETIKNKKVFREGEMRKARTDFNARLRKYINHGVDYLTDGLAEEDINTITMMCEGIARIILTMFNQDKYAAFPEEGNTLSEEIRLYKSQDDAKQPKADIFDVLLHDEITQEIVGGYNLRIRIVNNEGYIVKRTAHALSTLNSLLNVTSYNFDVQEAQKYLNYYNNRYDFAIRTHDQDLNNYNQKIGEDNLNNALYYHVAKHLYAVFDFKPLEASVLAPKRGTGNAIKVYPSAGGIREAEYLVQEGDEYRGLKINEAKGYNDKAIFRSQMADKLMGEILSSKIVSHVIIHLVPYRQLREGFLENVVEEGLGNGMQETLKSFIDLVRQDYINAQFHGGIDNVLNNDWVEEILKRYQEQNKSFSGASSIIVDESHTKKLPGEGGIDESYIEKPPEEGGIDESYIEKLPEEGDIGKSYIEKLPKKGGVSDIEQRLKGVKEHIHIGGYMKRRKSNLQMVFEDSHSSFLARSIGGNDTDSITQWVENNLMKSDDQIRGGKVSKIAFYEAEKSLIREYILKGEFNNIVTLLDAIHNEKFKNEDSYQELKIEECEVLAGAIKMAERSLRRDYTMHESLRNLLEGKQKELKKIKDTDLEKDGVSTRITEALVIVQASLAAKDK